MERENTTGFDEAAENILSMPAGFELDAAKYLPELADFDMTDAQKQELLETLWSIMRAFVELGFSVNICEQIFENADAISDAMAGDVNSPGSTTLEMPPETAP